MFDPASLGRLANGSDGLLAVLGPRPGGRRQLARTIRPERLFALLLVLMAVRELLHVATRRQDDQLVAQVLLDRLGLGL